MMHLSVSAPASSIFSSTIAGGFRKWKRSLALFCVVTPLFLLATPRPAMATISYRVSLADSAQHSFAVTMTVPVKDEKEVVVAMPAWNALYQIRDFAYRVHDLRTDVPANNGLSCKPLPIDKQTWRVPISSQCLGTQRPQLTLEYSIVWDVPGPFDSQLNTHHAFMNLAEILMYVPDRRAEDTSVTFDDVPNRWRTATELVAAHTENSYSALSYDALVDAPVEAGQFDEFQFDQSGVTFHVVLDGGGSWKKNQMEEALQRITAYEMKLMGGPPPFDPPNRDYTFFLHIGTYEEAGSGGMEHRNSTAIAAPSAESAVAVAAHEFFHVWNVKRIRPRALEPVDYTKEQFTRALWFAEGCTSAYASYTLERTGLWTKSGFYEDLAAQISELQSRPAHKWQSVEESSLDAWFEKYDDYNQPDRSISYYNKGQILGFLLDLQIRDATDNRKSLDDVMRRMNEEYARQGKFYDDSDGIRAVVEEVAGKSFEDFFRRYVSGVDEIPYNDFLAVAGLQLNMGTQNSSDTQGRGRQQALVSEIDHPTERQKRLREGILRGSTN